MWLTDESTDDAKLKVRCMFCYALYRIWQNFEGNNIRGFCGFSANRESFFLE